MFIISKIKDKFKKTSTVKLRERKIVSITPIVTTLNVVSQSDFTVIVHCDDDSLWMSNNRELGTREQWKRLRDIPKF